MGRPRRDLATVPESTFWYWIAERHAVYLRRQSGKPKPWTTDPILRHYKFTNAFRQLDRGTVWLTENFLAPHRKTDAEWAAMSEDTQNQLLSEIAFNCAWYRMFNWYGTGELLGWRTTWDVEEIKAILTDHKDHGGQVFTGAHIVYSSPGRPKIDAIVEVCADLYHMCFEAGALVTSCREDHSLEVVFDALTEVHSVGGFMAYEMVSDMRHTRLLENAHDIMTWANPGPGAKRGLQRLGLPYRRDDDAIESMRGLLARSTTGLYNAPDPATPGNAHVPPLEMRDIEHSLCEMDKYVRVFHGEGEPRGKFAGD